jgi:glycerophosphoryl diester phosphodiesterase
MTFIFFGSTLLVSTYCLSETYEAITLNDNTSASQSRDLYNNFEGDVLRLLAHLKENQQSVVIAHRGGIAPGFPENSMAAILRSTREVPVILEVDIMSTKDGIDILHHDRTFERTTTGMGEPRELSWEAIRSFKLKDQSNRVLDMNIMRFEGFLEIISQETFLILDMKAPSSDQNIVDMIKEYNMLKSTIFIAYNLHQAKRIRKASSDAILALGVPNLDTLVQIQLEGLANSSFIALTGDVQTPPSSNMLNKLSRHFVAVGSYSGVNPIDAQVESGERLQILKQSVELGLVMIASNQAIAMHKALLEMDLSVDLKL